MPLIDLRDVVFSRNLLRLCKARPDAVIVDCSFVILIRSELCPLVCA